MTREMFYLFSVVAALLVGMVIGRFRMAPRLRVCRWSHTYHTLSCEACARDACGGAPGRAFCDMGGRCDRHARGVS